MSPLLTGCTKNYLKVSTINRKSCIYHIAFIICIILTVNSRAQTISPSGNVAFCGTGTLTVTGAAPGTTFQWQLNGSNTGGNTSSLAVSASGSYTVNLTTPAQGTLGPVIVNVNPLANPVFDYTPNTCSGSTVSFTSNITGTNYSWDFGDGGTSTASNPSHVFTSLGCGINDFTVTLSISGVSGCANTITVQRAVTIRQAPDIGLSDLLNPFVIPPVFSNCGNSPTAANPDFFINIGNASNDAACISNYTLDWGDGSPVVNPLTFPRQHTYNTLGTFNMILTGTGNNGCTNSKTYKVINLDDPAVGIAGPQGTSGCAPLGFWFKLTGYQTNSPGTYYVWDFGDNSPTVRWDPPILVDSIFHIFQQSSCGRTNNEFIVKVTATNDCLSKSAYVDGVKVYTKPEAYFKSPSFGCTSQPVCFIDSSATGFGLNCSTNPVYNWNFGDPGSGANNTSTIKNPCHTYTSAGNYIITLTLTNSCGSSTFTDTICITAPAMPSFNVDTTELCTSGTVQVTNTSIPGTCAGIKYKWTVSYVGGYCGTASGWVFAPGSNDSSLNPVFIFNNTGTYNISLVITGPCPTTTPVIKTIKVKRKPIAPVLGIVSSYCDSARLCPTTNAQSCGDLPLTYLWQLDGAPFGNSQNQNPGCETLFSAGQHILSLSATNECGTTKTDTVFTVGAGPGLVLANPSPAVYCPGQQTGDFNFTSSTPGTNITWTNSNTGIGLSNNSGSGSIPSFTTVNATTAPLVAIIKITATLAGGCKKDSSFTITVNPKPAPPGTNPLNYCTGNTAIPLTAIFTAGHTLVWYTIAAGGTGSTAAPTPSTTVPGTTNYYVSQVSTATNCESDRAMITVTVAATPTISDTSFTHPANCGAVNGTISLMGLTPSASYTVQYFQNGNPITRPSIPTNAAGTLTITGLAAGTYTNVTVTLAGCPSAPRGPFLLADPNPPATPTAGYNSPVCEGDNLQFNAFSATPGVSYIWRNPLGGVFSTQQNPTINPVTLAAAGNYTVTAILNGCSSQPVIVPVTVNPKPAPPGTNPVNYCTGNTAVPLTATPTTGNTLLWYTVATGGAGSTTAPTPSTTVPGTTNYYVSQVNTATNCESNRALITVTVAATPTFSGSSFTHPINCGVANGTISLTGLNPSTSYTVQYLLNGNPATPTTISSNAAGTLTIGGLAAGTYNNIIVTLAGCPSAPQGPFVLNDPNPPPPPTAWSNSPVCEGDNLQFNVSSPTAGVSYTWYTPSGGLLSMQQNPAINPVILANAGTYTVTTMLNNCTSQPATVTVVVNPSPPAPLLSANTPVCANDTIKLFSNPNFPAAVTYSWNGPPPFTSNQQNPVIPNATTAMAGAYSLVTTSVLGNCPSPSASINVNVIPRPFISSSSSVNPVGCGTSTGSIILNGLLPLTSYTVYYSHNGGPLITRTILTNSAGTLVIGGLPAGTYTNVGVSLNGCSTTLPNIFTLTDTAPFSVNATTNGQICQGNNLLLFAMVTAPGNAVYSWTGAGNFTSPLQNPVIPNAGPQHSGTYYVSATLNGCTVIDSVTGTVSARSVGGVTGPDASVCKGNNSGVVNLSNQLGTVVRWESSITNGATWATIANTSATIAYTNLTVNHWYRAIVKNGVCPFTYSDTTVITVVNNIDSVKIKPASFGTCAHDTTITFTATTFYTGTDPVRYSWYVNGQLQGTANPFSLVIHVPANRPSDSLITVNVVAENIIGCGIGSNTVTTITIRPIPKPGIKVLPGYIQYQPEFTFSFADSTTASPSYRYSWDMGDRSPLRLLRQFNHRFPDIGVYNVKLSVTDISNDCWGYDSAKITIRPVSGYLHVPNAFSPGAGPAGNRIFKAVGSGLEYYRLRIFDGHGTLLFQTEKLDPDGVPSEAWDGTYRGQTMPQDTYLWVIDKAVFRNLSPWQGMKYNNGGLPKPYGTLILIR